MSKKISGKPNKMPTALPKAPILHEEPIQGLSSEKEVCKICGKTVRNYFHLPDTSVK